MSSTVYRNRAFTVYSYVRPLHTAGARTITFRFYRYESGRWVLRKTAAGKNSTYNSTTTKVILATSLPYAGTWRVYAYHPKDSQIAVTSTYKSITVK